jgi:Coenzyme PQQ synthesis protein D (PqqD)
MTLHCTKPGMVLTPCNGVRAVVSPEGLVLLSIDKGAFFRSNCIGARIWEKLTAGASVGKTIREIAEEFRVPDDTAGPDVEQFVSSLVEQGFLRFQTDI